MGSRFALPLLLVAAIAAGGLFWWLSGTGGSGRTPEAVAPRDAQAPASRAGAEDLVEASPVEDEDRPALAERTVLDRPGAADATPTEDTSSGRRVRGRVVDRLGNPIEGATVRASDQEGIPLDLTGDAFPWAKRYEDTTDADGEFELRGAPAGTLRMAVRAPGYAPYDKRGIVVPDEDLVELDPVRLSLGAILTGHVLDKGGLAIAGAELFRIDDADQGGFVLLGGRREPVAVSEADGSFRIDQLACGPWKIQVRSDEHPDRTFEGLAERPGEVVAGLQFVLDPGTTLAGTVTGVPAAERGQLTVRATVVDDGNWFARLRGRTADVDADGGFTLRGLAIDREYDLVVRRKNDPAERYYTNSSRSEIVRARAGDGGVVIPYQPEAAIAFQVIDAGTGAPLTDFQVEAGVGWPQPVRGEDGKPLEFHPEGRVRVGSLRLSDPDERVELAVHATGYRDYRRDDITVANGQELDLGRILLDPVPVVRVTVRDAATNAAVADAKVEIAKQQPAGQASFNRRIEIDSEEGIHSELLGGRSEKTDENGLAEISSMEGETVTLTVRADGHARFELRDLFLPEGQDVEQTVQLTPGGSVVVTIVDAAGQPMAGARVRHRRPSEASQGMMMMFGPGGGDTEVTDSAGEATFANLEPGLHEFQLSESGGGGMFLAGGGDEDVVAVDFAGGGGPEEDWTGATVVEGEVARITIQAPPRGSLVGHVREAGRVLAGASLSLQERKDRSPREQMMMPFGGGGKHAKSDGSGEYVFEDVKEGTYTLRVEHPTRRMPQQFEVDVKAGENRFDVELPVSIVEGRITDPAGEPVPGVTVSAERAQKDEGGFRGFAIRMESSNGDTVVSTSNDMGGDSVTTDSDGRYSLRGVQPDVELVVKADGDQIQPKKSDPLTVAADQVKRGVDLTVEPGGKVTVEALLSDGAPARFCMVRATYLGDAEGVEPKFSFLESGSVTLTGMRPGPWTINLQKAGPGRDDDDPGVDRDVEVRAGETATTTIRLD